MNLYQKLINSNSFTEMGWIIEDEIDSNKSNVDYVKELRHMQGLNKLDEIYAHCYDKIGQPEKAKELRDFLSRRSERAKNLPHEF